MQLYFAAPFYSKAEKVFNEALARKLEAVGYEVFLPQRDGVEKRKAKYKGMSDDEQGKALFQLAKEKVLACNVFLYILDGRVPDEGAAVELGMAFAEKELRSKDKLLVGYQTDIRAAFISSQLNPMLREAFDHLTCHEKELIDYLKSYHFSISKKNK